MISKIFISVVIIGMKNHIDWINRIRKIFFEQFSFIVKKNVIIELKTNVVR